MEEWAEKFRADTIGWLISITIGLAAVYALYRCDTEVQNVLPPPYQYLCEFASRETSAPAVALIVIGGSRGDGACYIADSTRIPLLLQELNALADSLGRIAAAPSQLTP